MLLDLIGECEIEQWRKDEMIRRIKFRNMIVTDGKAIILDTFFKKVANPFGSFYVGLLPSTWASYANPTPVLATLQTESFTQYTGDRKAINFDVAANTSSDPSYVYIENSTANYITFAITGSGILNGIFICDSPDSTPTHLWCMAAFGNVDASPTNMTVAASDTLKLQYKIKIPKT